MEKNGRRGRRAARGPPVRTRNWSPAPGGRGGAGRGALRAGRRRRARPAPGGRRAPRPGRAHGAAGGRRRCSFRCPRPCAPRLPRCRLRRGFPASGVEGTARGSGALASLAGRAGKTGPWGRFVLCFCLLCFFRSWRPGPLRGRRGGGAGRRVCGRRRRRRGKARLTQRRARTPQLGPGRWRGVCEALGEVPKKTDLN